MNFVMKIAMLQHAYSLEREIESIGFNVLKADATEDRAENAGEIELIE